MNNGQLMFYWQKFTDALSFTQTSVLLLAKASGSKVKDHTRTHYPETTQRIMEIKCLPYCSNTFLF